MKAQLLTTLIGLLAIMSVAQDTNLYINAQSFPSPIFEVITNEPYEVDFLDTIDEVSVFRVQGTQLTANDNYNVAFTNINLFPAYKGTININGRSYTQTDIEHLQSLVDALSNQPSAYLKGTERNPYTPEEYSNIFDGHSYHIWHEIPTN